MVGVPTSHRCDTCKTRKKKCDERKPQCTPCIRSGWKCPGYHRRWKFVDEIPQLEEHYAENKYVMDVLNAKDSELTLDTLRTTPSVPRYFDPKPLGSEFIYSLNSNVAGMLFPLQLAGSFFHFIPARLGRNVALDDAIQCICSIYSKALPAPHETSKGTYQSYARAIASLRACLDDPVLQMESETLCASIILQFCELVVNVDRGEWSQLLLGTICLLQLRGIQRYDNEYDHAMLESQVGFIFGHSLRFRDSSFMSSPEWRALLFHNLTWPFQIQQPKSLKARTRLIGILVDLPILIGSASAESTSFDPQLDKRIDVLIARFCQVSLEIRSWLEFEAEPFLTVTSSCQNTDLIQYPDLTSAINDCVSHKALLMIEKALRILIETRGTDITLTLGAKDLSTPSSLFRKNANSLLNPLTLV
ncbi:hypothetical protein ONS95_002340 [Cadophora gregata]|uniref:uncharacterized protein n=1 Tax=Cadophora gregata TaxID=51156 RepID=UPI0026DC6639|nr:uncharacterized protein ONS95_002340 [Cadophora gregata]KAK0109659.1 hypothetical protein ONS95_002340 [Cadophora gregata]